MFVLRYGNAAGRKGVCILLLPPGNDVAGRIGPAHTGIGRVPIIKGCFIIVIPAFFFGNARSPDLGRPEGGSKAKGKSGAKQGTEHGGMRMFPSTMADIAGNASQKVGRGKDFRMTFRMTVYYCEKQPQLISMPAISLQLRALLLLLRQM